MDDLSKPPAPSWWLNFRAHPGKIIGAALTVAAGVITDLINRGQIPDDTVIGKYAPILLAIGAGLGWLSPGVNRPAKPVDLVDSTGTRVAGGPPNP